MRTIDPEDIIGEHFGQLARIRRHAETRGIEFSITIEHAWDQFIRQNRRCALSGEVLTMTRIKSQQKRRTASLDRIDSTLGYVPGNIQWLHKEVNLIKGNRKSEEFVAICTKIAEHQRLLRYSSC